MVLFIPLAAHKGKSADQPTAERSGGSRSQDLSAADSGPPSEGGRWGKPAGRRGGQRQEFGHESQRQFHVVRHAELVVEPLEVGVNGARRNPKASGDGGFLPAVQKPAHDLGFARRQVQVATDGLPSQRGEHGGAGRARCDTDGPRLGFREATALAPGRCLPPRVWILVFISTATCWKAVRRIALSGQVPHPLKIHSRLRPDAMPTTAVGSIRRLRPSRPLPPAPTVLACGRPEAPVESARHGTI